MMDMFRIWRATANGLRHQFPIEGIEDPPFPRFPVCIESAAPLRILAIAVQTTECSLGADLSGWDPGEGSERGSSS
eukprot:678603-Rhodomonas_salina.3